MPNIHCTNFSIVPLGYEFAHFFRLFSLDKYWRGSWNRFIFGTLRISAFAVHLLFESVHMVAMARVRPWFRRQIWCAVKRCSVAFRFNVKKRTITVIQCAAAAKPIFIAEVYTKWVDDGRTELFVFSWHFFLNSKQDKDMLYRHIVIGGEYANANRKNTQNRGGAFYGERFIPGVTKCYFRYDMEMFYGTHILICVIE